MNKFLYLWVTPDKYELPLAVCNNAVELAKVSGYSLSTVYSLISRSNKGKRSSFIKVEVED